MDPLFTLTAALLQVGEPIPWDIYDSNGVLLLKTGSVISSERQLDHLLERGASTKVPYNEALRQAGLRESDVHPFLVWHQVESELGQLYTVTDPDEFPKLAKNISQFIDKMVTQNPNGSLAAMLLNMHHRYPVSHSLHVAIISAIVGKRMDMDVESLICAALTMNLSMIDLQNILYRQQAPITPEQKLAVRKHPTESANMLVHRGILKATWLRLVAEHHEPDYPTGNVGHQDSMLLHICDVYTAKFSGRSYRTGISPEEAILSTLRPFKDQRAMHQLLRSVGIYPPGLMLKLVDGTLAIVLKVTDEFAAPHVAQVVDKNGQVMDGKKRMTIGKDKILAVVPRSKVAANFPYDELYSHLND